MRDGSEINMIKVPHYNWFFQMQGKTPITNVYSGSSGTSATEGCLTTITFNYAVYIETDVKENEPYYIVAEWYYAYPWGSVPPRSEKARKTFENSPEGLEAAVDWLTEAEIAENRT